MAVLGRFDTQPLLRNISMIQSETLPPLVEICYAFSGALSPNESRWLSAFLPEFLDFEMFPCGGGYLEDNFCGCAHDLCCHIDHFVPQGCSINLYRDKRSADFFLESLIEGKGHQHGVITCRIGSQAYEGQLFWSKLLEVPVNKFIGTTPISALDDPCSLQPVPNSSILKLFLHLLPQSQIGLKNRLGMVAVLFTAPKDRTHFVSAQTYLKGLKPLDPLIGELDFMALEGLIIVHYHGVNLNTTTCGCSMLRRQRKSACKRVAKFAQDEGPVQHYAHKHVQSSPRSENVGCRFKPINHFLETIAMINRNCHNSTSPFGLCADFTPYGMNRLLFQYLNSKGVLLQIQNRSA